MTVAIPGTRKHWPAPSACVNWMPAPAPGPNCRRYLARKGVPSEPADRVLDRFTQVGLIDDQALAESFVESRHHQAGMGRRALTQKLRQRGVDDAVIESAVAVVDADSELAVAQDLVRRKLRSLSTLEPQAQARRLVGMLARKGYSPGLAYQVVREALAEVDLPTDVDD